METIGQRLKRLRLAKKMNQVEVAAALPDFDRSYLSKIENDKKIPSWEIFCALADLYDVGVDYLRFGDFPPSNQTSGQFVKDPAELALLRAWRAMDDSEKRLFAGFAEKFGMKRAS